MVGEAQVHLHDVANVQVGGVGRRRRSPNELVWLSRNVLVVASLCLILDGVNRGHDDLWNAVSGETGDELNEPLEEYK